MNADIARSWIVANVISIAVTATLGLAGYGLLQLLSIGTADVTFLVQAAYLAAEVAISTFSFALFARLTGAVLAAVIALPHREWLSLHLVLGILGGLGYGLISLQPESESESFDWNDTAFVVFTFAIFAVAGALAGATFASLQALVLRRVATGLRLWIASGAAALGIVTTLILIAVLTVIPSEQGLVPELVMASAFVMAGVAGAVVMIPAVQRLRPK